MLLCGFTSNLATPWNHNLASVLVDGLSLQFLTARLASRTA